ncbi:hypothetical protein IGI04_025604 [Brassica rapa subsp. trilocularis]|uniref:Uncharacterized protein n=1 Tax=Brassica rapa subsp. trilocularis TaxID=1813537 RepID=A0ABQ7KTV2_BRACM|nr:hypothetical protein IGI04_025604 [Brassica rapa subsp. trilocularis]
MFINTFVPAAVQEVAYLHLQPRALHQQLRMVRPVWRPQKGLTEKHISKGTSQNQACEADMSHMTIGKQVGWSLALIKAW